MDLELQFEQVHKTLQDIMVMQACRNVPDSFKKLEYSADQVGSLIGRTPQYVNKKARDGIFPSHRRGNSNIFYYADVIEVLKKACPNELLTIPNPKTSEAGA